MTEIFMLIFFVIKEFYLIFCRFLTVSFVIIFVEYIIKNKSVKKIFNLTDITDLTKNTFVLSVINFFTDAQIFIMLCGGILFLGNKFEELSVAVNIFVLTIMLTAFIGRLFVMPLAYNAAEKSQKFEYVSNFIRHLKHSGRLKLLFVLIISVNPESISIIKDFNSITGLLLSNLLFGQLGSYLVLFAYWFAEDIIKKRNTEKK